MVFVSQPYFEGSLDKHPTYGKRGKIGACTHWDGRRMRSSKGGVFASASAAVKWVATPSEFRGGKSVIQ